MKRKLYIDWETYYDTTSGYTLDSRRKNSVSIVQYVRSPRFKAFGLAYAWDDGQSPVWLPGHKINGWINDIAKTYQWPNIALVAHNIKFDAFILREQYEVVPGQFIDTKGMSKAVLGKSIVGHGLADLAVHFGLSAKQVETLTEMDGKETLTPDEEQRLAGYCIHDVELCREIEHRLAAEFPDGQYEALHRTVDMFVSPKLQLNVPLLEQTTKDEADRRRTIFEELELTPQEMEIAAKGVSKKKLLTINKAELVKGMFSSNAKFPKLLELRGYECPMKESPKKKDEKGNAVQIPALALGDTDFLELMGSANEELKTLCEARLAAKSTLLETRSAKLAAIGATGLWPFDVEFSGADQTHRFSGGSGAGGNPQNFTACRDKRAHKEGHRCPGRLRTSVEAPDNCRLIVGDFSNIELRIVAFLSKDPGLVQAIREGKDIYCDFSSTFYGRLITKMDELERKFGKTAILGLGYQMGWQKFIRTVRIQTGQTISDEASKKAVDLYRTRYAGVKALWDALDNMIQTLATDGTHAPRTIPGIPVKFGYQHIELPSGLKLKYTNLRQESALNPKTGRTNVEWVYDVYDKRRLERRKLYGGKVLENISQAIAGELCKEAMLKMGENVTGLVHDEIHVVCKKGLGLVTAQKLKRVMSVAPDWFPQIILDAEVGVGANWKDAH